MPKSRCLLALCLLAAGACGPDAAKLEREAVQALRVEVPALQTAYRAANGRYATHVRELTGGADTLPSGVRVLIHGANDGGWAATSSHREVPGAACAVFVGDPDVRPNLRGGVSPHEPGQVACMAFEPWKKRGAIERSGPFAIAR